MNKEPEANNKQADKVAKHAVTDESAEKPAGDSDDDKKKVLNAIHESLRASANDKPADKPTDKPADAEEKSDCPKPKVDYSADRKGYGEPNVLHAEDGDGDCKPKGPNTQTSIHKCHKSLTTP